MLNVLFVVNPATLFGALVEDFARVFLAEFEVFVDFVTDEGAGVAALLEKGADYFIGAGGV